MTNQELTALLDRLKALMVAGATGGPNIQQVEADFLEMHDAAPQPPSVKSPEIADPKFKYAPHSRGLA